MILFVDQSTQERIEKTNAAGIRPTAEQQAEFFTFQKTLVADRGEGPRALTVAGDQAEISVRGLLTQAPMGFMAWLMGFENTTYGDIIAALAAADADPDVKAIILATDSPGGEWDGMFEALNAINRTVKPVTARVDALGASAAFAVVSQADSITAANLGVRVGSIGVAIDTIIYDGGPVIDVSIASTPAPKKRPDLLTPEGKAIAREELDELHALFVNTIAAGRTAATGEAFDAERINQTFGQGATVLAADALTRGMLDSIADNGAKRAAVSTANKNTAPKGGEKKETRTMDKATLQAEHPAVYAAVLAEGHAAGVTEGAEGEKKRASAHLKRGTAVGAMDVATKAIEAGTAFMDDEVQAEYLNASAKKTDVAAAAADDGTVAPPPAPPAAAGTGEPATSAIDLLEHAKGVKTNG